MKRIILAISASILIFFFTASSGQETRDQKKFNDLIIQPYVKDHTLSREQVYLHLNKSCYLPGDDIWFSAYITDPLTGLLNSYTRNLYVELYTSKGKLLGQKILPVNNGTANNFFTLREDDIPGNYIIRAYTNWMKNFGSPEEFDREIQIVGKEANEKHSENPKYDVQFFPEGGTLLHGVFNKVAVKALDPNGKSAILTGVITTSNSDTVADFKLNKMGFGEFTLNPSEGTEYKAKIVRPDGIEEIFPLPKSQPRGIIVSANVLQKERIIIELKSNESTIDKEKPLFIMIHSNGNVYQWLTAELKPGQESVTFPIERKNTGNGVNCITVFDEDYNPVAERLFYNDDFNIRGRINLAASPAGDSIQFSLSVNNDSVVPKLSNLSISVLPEGTVSNKFETSLLAGILLKSGVRGYIENPKYYFEKKDLEHIKAMDLLLLTQGWRKYNWEELKNSNGRTRDKKYKYEFEDGFTIRGNVRSWLSGKADESGNVTLISPENNLFTIAKADNKGNFSLPGLYLADSTRVMVSASSSKGKNWNRTIDASFIPFHPIDTLIENKPFVTLKEKTEEKKEEPLKLLPGVIQLPEFVITAEQKRPFENSTYVSSFDKAVEITKENYSRYTTIEALLMLEFNVHVSVDPEGNYVVEMGRGSKTATPKLIIDDMEAPDMSYLSMYSINQIEAVSVNKDGNAITGDGGAIILKTRKEAIDWGFTMPSNMKILFIKGFSPPVEYYMPKYLQSPESETFQKYASIFWKPDIAADSTGRTAFRLYAPGEIKKVNVRIEGISNDGTVYLDERVVQIR